MPRANRTLFCYLFSHARWVPREKQGAINARALDKRMAVIQEQQRINFRAFDTAMVHNAHDVLCDTLLCLLGGDAVVHDTGRVSFWTGGQLYHAVPTILTNDQDQDDKRIHVDAFWSEQNAPLPTSSHMAIAGFKLTRTELNFVGGYAASMLDEIETHALRR